MFGAPIRSAANGRTRALRHPRDFAATSAGATVHACVGRVLALLEAERCSAAIRTSSASNRRRAGAVVTTIGHGPAGCHSHSSS